MLGAQSLPLGKARMVRRGRASGPEQHQPFNGFIDEGVVFWVLWHDGIGEGAIPP